jgi:hypothetical protein
MSQIIDFALAEKTFVYDRLAYVCDTFGPRFSGTPALEAAIDSIYQTATADGLKVTQEPVMYVYHQLITLKKMISSLFIQK